MRWNPPSWFSVTAEASPTNQSTSTTRRRVLSTAGALATVGLAGCSNALNAVAGAILKDVNVINGTEQERSGSITVVGPSGETRLDETFTVAPEDSEADDDGPSSTPTYEDVFAGSGEYTVSVALNPDSAIDGTTDVESTVTVDTPDDQHVIVGLGANQTDQAVEILVIDEFSDLAEKLNASADENGSS